MGSRVEVAVSVGELADKTTILEIKSERITDPAKLEHIRRERAALEPALARFLEAQPKLAALKASLRSVNESLWQIEDDIRDCERKRDFGPRFIELARSVYRTNDRRAALKREIDELVGSEIAEQKSYAAYD